MKKCKVMFGSRELVREFPCDATIGDVLDENAKAVLGYGDNVRIMVLDVEQNRCANAPDIGLASIVIETRCNQKAS